MKQLPDANQLKSGFFDFAQLAIELLSRAEKDSKYLKFAAVNAQVALELFLKYYYVKKGKLAQIQKQKNGICQNDFVEHSQILNHYYSQKEWSFGAKRQFVSLMEARNSILHKAQQTEWDIELAITVVRTLFFIHGTWHLEFDEYLFEHNFKNPHTLANNEAWKQGASSFVDQLMELHGIKALTCLSCNQRNVLSGEFFGLADTDGMEHLICLNCFNSINIEHEAKVIQCYRCKKKSYIIDVLNEQRNQLYVAKCTECDESRWVRKCTNCEEFFHPQEVERHSRGDYFCTTDCAKMSFE